MNDVIRDDAIPCIVMNGNTISELVSYVRTVTACGKLHLQRVPVLCKTSSKYMEVLLTSQNSNKSNTDLITFFTNAATMCSVATREKMTIVVYGNPLTLLSICRRIRYNYDSMLQLYRVIVLIGNDASQVRTYAECRRILNGFACFLKFNRPDRIPVNNQAISVTKAFQAGNGNGLQTTLCNVLKSCNVSELLRSMCVSHETVHACVEVEIAMQSKFGNLYVFVWLVVIKCLQSRALRSGA